MSALWGNKFKGMGKNAAALDACVNELTPLAYALIPSDTLMGRPVVGHGDAHGCNTMHRTKDGHGDLVFVDLDFCGKFPAAVDVLGTVLALDSSGIFGFFFAGKSVAPYPTLASRKLVAKSYIDTLGEAVTGQFKRAPVDEVVFDMEIGVVLRLLWMVHIMTPFGFNSQPKCTGWGCLYFAKAATDILAKAATDAALTQKVLELGVCGVVAEALVAKELPLLGMSDEQYGSVWNLFGEGKPAFPGGPFPDDPPPPAAAAEKKATEQDNSFRAATLEYHKSTGADLDSVGRKLKTPLIQNAPQRTLLGVCWN